jgi:hypothetical protein
LNGWNNLEATLSSIPGPVSETLIITIPPSAARVETNNSRRTEVCMASIALRIKLRMTC